LWIGGAGAHHPARVLPPSPAREGAAPGRGRPPGFSGGFLFRGFSLWTSGLGKDAGRPQHGGESSCGRRYAPPWAEKVKAVGSRTCPGTGSLPGARTRERTVDLLWQGGRCREEKVPDLKIRIARKGQGLAGFYVGRPTPLGNPFRLEREDQREEVVARYATWLNDQVRRGDPEVIRALEEFYRALRQKGAITLLCFCAPRRCHAEVIAEYLRRRAQDEGLRVVVEVVGRS
jgi:hypothetical protein